MAEVGRLAGVSHQTVSRVINGSRHVSPGTRSRVRAAIAQLEYRPNSAARALATGRTRTLGVVSSDTTRYGPASTLAGIERAAHRAGYLVVVASVGALDRVTLAEAVERLAVHGVEGVLVLAPEAQAATALRDVVAQLPLVAIEAGPEPGIPAVSVDQRAGAVLATRHLLDLGHPTVHHVAGPPTSRESRLRLGGWKATLHAAGAVIPEPLLGDWDPLSGYEAGQRLARNPEVSAVFAANDQMALGVLRALHEASREIPEEIAVAGFDDIPEAAYLTPPLTTVRQDFAEVGRRSLAVLVRAIEGGADVGGSRESRLVNPELVVRASSGPTSSRMCST